MTQSFLQFTSRSSWKLQRLPHHWRKASSGSMVCRIRVLLLCTELCLPGDENTQCYHCFTPSTQKYSWAKDWEVKLPQMLECISVICSFSLGTQFPCKLLPQTDCQSQFPYMRLLLTDYHSFTKFRFLLARLYLCSAFAAVSFEAVGYSHKLPLLHLKLLPMNYGTGSLSWNPFGQGVTAYWHQGGHSGRALQYYPCTAHERLPRSKQ